MTVELRNRTKCRITEDITAAQTILPVGPGGAGFLPSTGNTTMAVLRDSTGFEVVAVTGAGIDTLAVERGQDGSTARAFKAGATVSMRLVKGGLVGFEQKGVMRQISYNPNGNLIPHFFGEKVSELGVDGCAHRIWQNILSCLASWRIIYGDMCQDIINWRDWDWVIIDTGWDRWPWPLPTPTPDPELEILLTAGQFVSAGGNISVSGHIDVAGYVSSGGIILCRGDISASKVTSGEGTMVGGDATTTETGNGVLSSGENVHVGGSVDSFDASCGDKFFVVGNVTIGAGFSSANGISVGGDVVVHGDLTTGGNFSAKSLVCDGAVSIQGEETIG